jgi:hypothetical protein
MALTLIRPLVISNKPVCFLPDTSRSTYCTYSPPPSFKSAASFLRIPLFRSLYIAHVISSNLIEHTRDLSSPASSLYTLQEKREERCLAKEESWEIKSRLELCIPCKGFFCGSLFAREVCKRVYSTVLYCTTRCKRYCSAPIEVRPDSARGGEPSHHSGTTPSVLPVALADLNYLASAA